LLLDQKLLQLDWLKLKQDVTAWRQRIHATAAKPGA
jgi:hypothetical protein